MRLTGKQAHVLDNLDRVRMKNPVLAAPDHHARFSLDGYDCTPQITSLVVKKLVAHAGTGGLVRLQTSLSSVALSASAASH